MTPDGQAINLPRRIWNKLDNNQAETEHLYNYIRIYEFDEVYSAFMESVKHDRKNLEFVEAFCQTRKERSEYLSSDQFKSEKRLNLLNEVYGAG
jgi:hypothetical protein